MIFHEHKPKNFLAMTEAVSCWYQVKDTILLLKNNNQKTHGYGDKWCFPGGSLQKEETAIEGIIREVAEETSIKISKKELQLVGTFYAVFPSVQYTQTIFTIIVTGNQPAITLSKEHTDATWVTIESALDMNLVPGGDEYIRLILEKLETI